jgi:hypothetical protein
MFKYMSVEIKDYEKFKTNLDIALTSTADNMVRVGYLLMQARDTEILNGSGYSGMGEFAQKEYGLTPDQTSRFIGIAERYGDGEGRLKDEWQQYGYTKLSEMLTLPEEVAKAIPPEITRDEIREIKNEIKAEQEITPIEAAIEQAQDREENPDAYDMPMIERFFLEYFRPAEHAEEFVKAMTTGWKLLWGSKENNRKAVLEALAPSGIAVLAARIPGKGRYFLSIKGEEAEPTLTSARDSKSESIDWTDIRHGFSDLIEDAPGEWEHEDMEDEENAKSLWSVLYGEDFPKKAAQEKKPEKKVKIAPAQSTKTRKSSSQGKDSKNTEPMNPPVAENENPESDISKGSGEESKNEEAEKQGDSEDKNPESGISERSGEDPEEDIDEDLDNRPKEEIEQELGETLKNVKRGNVQLAEAAGRIERLDEHKTWLYIEELTFNTDELWRKIKTDLQIITALKKSLEIRFPENEEGEDEP